MYVSNDCQSKQTRACSLRRSILAGYPDSTMELAFGDWGELEKLLKKHKSNPARVIAIVNPDEKKNVEVPSFVVP